MSERYYIEPPIERDEVELTGSEAHHLLHVMRAKAGDSVTLFDGAGGQYSACVARLGRSSVTLRLGPRTEVDRETARPLVLGAALPKGDRQKWLVEKAVEIGVGRLTPLITARGVAQPTGGAIERLRRSVVEASKQCGRNRLMEIASPTSVIDFFAQAPADARKWLAHPGGESIASLASGQPLGERGDWLAIGPEGGFQDPELSAAVQAGWRLVDLGPRILRVETAAIVLAAAAALASERKH